LCPQNSRILEENPVIIVLCRELMGTLADGSEWSLELKHNASKIFYKIELVRQ